MRRNRIKAWISLLLILALAMGCIGARAETPRKKVTVMVYMSGADLELKARAGSRVISQMYATRFNQDEVNVIVLCGGSRKWYSGLSTEALSVVDVGKGERRSLFVAEELPQANMGEPETLTAFLNLCAEKYPAETYDLVLWNHGGGPLYGVCGDYLHGEDYLTTQEMIQALSGSVLGEKGIDLIAMHACLMGSAEFAYAVAPYAKYYIASEDSQFGLDYGWLSGIENATPLETAQKMVDDSFAFNSKVIEEQDESETNSFAVLDLSKMQAVSEAVDGFFSEVTATMSDDTLNTLSGYRRDVQAFGKGESGGNSDFDLVDLGDLVNRYRDSSPEKAAALDAAIADAVVHKKSVNDELCCGMTVFHPYRNKKMASSRLEIYEELQFSKAYANYLNSFVDYLKDDPRADYVNLAAGRPEASKDARVLYIMPLTEDQAKYYGESTVKVLLKGEDGSYTFTYMGRETALKDGTVSGEYVKNAVFPTDAQGNRLSEAVAYEVRENGQYVIPATLIKHETEEYGESADQALITFGYDQETRKLIPGSVHLLNEQTGGYTVAYGMQYSDYDEIRLSFVSREETRNEKGTLLPFDEWKETASREWTGALDGSWDFVLTEEALDEKDLYLTFEVTDTQNYRYSSDLLQLGGPGPIGVQVDYDDLNLIRINANNASLSTLGGQMVLSLEVVNLTETESIIALRNLTINGQAAPETAEAYGTGENWGLLKDEAQTLSLTVTGEHLPEEPVTEMTFDLQLQNAADNTEGGTVPVRVMIGQEQAE